MKAITIRLWLCNSETGLPDIEATAALGERLMANEIELADLQETSAQYAARLEEDEGDFLSCAECGRYAPQDRQGYPMWSNTFGALCTQCAGVAYVNKNGGDPAKAELYLIEDRMNRLTPPDFEAMAAERRANVARDPGGIALGLETCAECGALVNPATLTFSEAPVLLQFDYAERVKNNMQHPEGAYLCPACDALRWPLDVFSDDELQGAAPNPFENVPLTA